MEILDILIQRGVLKKEFYPEAVQRIKDGESFETVLESYGVKRDSILNERATYYNLPIKKLRESGVEFEILKYIPEDSARHYRFAPLDMIDGVLAVGLTDPDNIETRNALQFIATKLGVPFKIFLISDADFDTIIQNYQGLTGEVTKALSDLDIDLSDSKKVEMIASQKEEDDDKEVGSEAKDAHLVESAPVAKITAVILRHAAEGGASDVHIEHAGDNVRVRFRVDGELFTSLILPVNVHSSVVARIKILANLKLDEKRKPQDGRFSARIDGHKIDFRVSTFPAYYGEKVVMRILDTQKGIKAIPEIGFNSEDLKKVQSALNRSYGLILITGPTGSGKSTTLYSILNSLNKETKNIVSLEDPVEYNISGISQSQMRPEIGYTFATGLRTALRQDPDIIMVGEIRDKETAQLAINAALTGHLVLSTLHTNTSIGAIPRLIDMGVDPYLIAPTLVLSIGQRLVKTIIPGAERKMYEDEAIDLLLERQFSDFPQDLKEKLGLNRPLHRSVSTPDSATGLRGRVAVYEVFSVDKEIEKIIITDPTELTLYEVARKKGMLTMKENAILKCMDGIVPFEEINSL